MIWYTGTTPHIFSRGGGQNHGNNFILTGQIYNRMLLPHHFGFGHNDNINVVFIAVDILVYLYLVKAFKLNHINRIGKQTEKNGSFK